MQWEINGIEKMRETLNKLVENIDVLNKKDRE